MTTVLVIGNNDNWWNELEHYASVRQCLQNGKMTQPSGKGRIIVCLTEQMTQIRRGIRSDIPNGDTMLTSIRSLGGS